MERPSRGYVQTQLHLTGPCEVTLIGKWRSMPQKQHKSSVNGGCEGIFFLLCILLMLEKSKRSPLDQFRNWQKWYYLHFQQKENAGEKKKSKDFSQNMKLKKKKKKLLRPWYKDNINVSLGPGIIWNWPAAVFLLSKTTLPKCTTTQAWLKHYIRTNGQVRIWTWHLKADAWAAKPFLQHNSLIEGRCWQAFFFSGPQNTMALWLSYRKLCHTRGSNYVPKEGRECTLYAYSMGKDYKE